MNDRPRILIVGANRALHAALVARLSGLEIEIVAATEAPKPKPVMVVDEHFSRSMARLGDMLMAQVAIAAPPCLQAEPRREAQWKTERRIQPQYTAPAGRRQYRKRS